MGYELSRRATGQLERILAHRRQNAGVGGAARLRAKLVAGFEHIAAHRRIGRHRPDLTTRPYRFWYKDGYWIVYRLHGAKPPLILAIIEARRDVAGLLG